jgi:hypothetical protein
LPSARSQTGNLQKIHLNATRKRILKWIIHPYTGNSCWKNSAGRAPRMTL